MRNDRASTPPLRSTGFFLAASLLFSCSTAFAADVAGTVKTLKGNAHIERGTQKIPATPGSRILVSDRIVTGPDSSIGITLRDNTLLSAGPDSTLILNQFSFDSTTHSGAVDATVKRGTLGVVSGKIAKASPDKVVFNAPSVTLGVRGTEFILEAGSDERGAP